MAQYNRAPKTKQKGPDEFVSFFDHVVRYFSANRKVFIGGIAVVIMAFIGFGIYLYQQSQNIKTSATIYETALEVPEEEAQTQWETLKNKGLTASLHEAVAARLAALLTKENQWNQAAKEYKVVASSNLNIFKWMGQYAQAVSLENAKDYEAALAFYDSIINDQTSPFKEDAKLGKARVLIGSGQRESGIKLLQGLVAKGGENAPRVQASARVELLAAYLEDESQ